MKLFLFLFIIFFHFSSYSQTGILPSQQGVHYKKDEASCSSSETQLALPNQAGTYPNNVRGYYFTAPIDFCITGLKVDPTVATSNQSVAVVKLNQTPPAYSSTTNNFTVLHYSAGVAVGKIIVDIQISQGDIVGILGCGNDNCVSSYGSPQDYPSAIGGQSVVLKRTGMQFNLKTTSPKDIFSEPANANNNLSRVELYYKY